MAKILKKRGFYLEEKAKKNAKLFILFLIMGLSSLLFYRIPFVIYFSLLSFLISLSFFAKYSKFKKGFEGEEAVAECLKNNLDDSYYIINDIKLKYGNIDHVVIGPTGIFVIETKNYGGEIVCNGDEWKIRSGEKEYQIKSPSRQAKKNALKIKKLIEEKLNRHAWINAIVVFTNPSINLYLNNNSIPILQMHELCDYIKNKKMMLSSSEIEAIAKVITHFFSLLH